MKLVPLIFCLLLLLSLNSILHAMPPKRYPDSLIELKSPQSILYSEEEEREVIDFRDKEEREDFKSEEEDDVIGQFSQDTLVGKGEKGAVQEGSYVLKELSPEESPCGSIQIFHNNLSEDKAQPDISPSRLGSNKSQQRYHELFGVPPSSHEIGFIDQIKKTFNSWSSMLGFSSHHVSSSKLPVKARRFERTVSKPVSEEKQSSSLKRSLDLTPSKVGVGSKMVRFQIENRKLMGERGDLESSFPGYEIIERYSLEMAQIQIQLKKDLKKLQLFPRGNPEQVVRASAKLQAITYPQARDVIEQVWRLAQKEPNQHEKMALFLANQTIKIFEMASKTVPYDDLQPIKTLEDPFFPEKSYIAVPFEVNALQIDEKYKLPSIDLEHEVIVETANHLIESLQSFKEIVSSSCLPEERGTALRQAQIDKTRREEYLSSNRYDCIQAKLASLTMWPVPIPNKKRDQAFVNELIKELLAESTLGQDLHKKGIDKINSQPTPDSLEAKHIAIEEIFSLIQPGLDAADNLREMLRVRRKKGS